MMARGHTAMRIATFLLSAAMIIPLSINIHKLDIFSTPITEQQPENQEAFLPAEVSEPESEPESDGEPEPESEPPGEEENQEPDATEPESEPETQPASAPQPQPQPPPQPQPQPEQALQVIPDGNYLLALVTKETTLKKDYAPGDLVGIPSYMKPSRALYLRAEAFKHLEEMWNAANTDGVTLAVLSAYRSYSYQAQLFNNYARRHGEAEANRFSARPGQSEHQLGTTIDFGGSGSDWSASFGETAQGKWLANNAYLYGFAMSYPRGMEHVTGYIYEPWHYRYIGVEAAGEWKESGQPLCVYLEQKQ